MCQTQLFLLGVIMSINMLISAVKYVSGMCISLKHPLFVSQYVCGVLQCSIHCLYLAHLGPNMIMSVAVATSVWFTEQVY
jgi:hypothetical protein